MIMIVVMTLGVSGLVSAVIAVLVTMIQERHVVCGAVRKIAQVDIETTIT